MAEYTLDYYIRNREGLYLDRKSARTKPLDIIRHVVAFANANGGTLVIGIEDDKKLTGFNSHWHTGLKSLKTKFSEIVFLCLLLLMTRFHME